MDTSFEVAMELYQRTAKRANRVSSLAGLLKGTLDQLIKYEEVNQEGKTRITKVLLEFNREWDKMYEDLKKPVAKEPKQEKIIPEYRVPTQAQELKQAKIRNKKTLCLE